MGEILKEKKRIAFILGTMSRGGAERVISLLADYYVNKGWNVDILMLLGNTVMYDLDQNIRLIPICGTNNGSRIKKIPGWLGGIRKYYWSYRPDFIVSFAARINVIALLALAGAKKRIIVSERNDPKNDTRGLIGSMMTKILYPFASVVVFQTSRAKSYFSKRVQANSVILPNPVTVGAYAGDTRVKKIVNVGRLLPQKNQEMLINAFYKVYQDHPDYVLYIYGDGELRGQLEKQIRSLNLEQAVVLRGSIPNIHQEIADASLFVLSSDYEGLSNALLEAMMMGLPCISTDCAGSDEVITDGVNGLLVPVGNTNRVAEAIERLIVDENLAHSLAANARKISEKFAKEKVLEMWDMVINGDSK